MSIRINVESALAGPMLILSWPYSLNDHTYPLVEEAQLSGSDNRIEMRSLFNTNNELYEFLQDLIPGGPCSMFGFKREVDRMTMPADRKSRVSFQFMVEDCELNDVVSLQTSCPFFSPRSAAIQFEALLDMWSDLFENGEIKIGDEWQPLSEVAFEEQMKLALRNA